MSKLQCGWERKIAAAFLLLIFGAAAPRAQTPDSAPHASAGNTPSGPTSTLYQQRFAPLNGWGIFAAGSPNSSHIFLGVAEQRRIVLGGFEYDRRLHLSNRTSIYFLAQARPLFFESDPALIGFREIGTGQLQFTQAPLRPVIIDHRHFFVAPGDVVVPAYTRQWTYGGGANAFGMKINFRTTHRIQPVVTWAAGFLITQRDVPIDHSAAFNFSFELGGGLEWFFQPHRSFRLDYRVHHISNANTGTHNPGIDSGLFQLTYAFGK